MRSYQAAHNASVPFTFKPVCTYRRPERRQKRTRCVAIQQRVKFQGGSGLLVGSSHLIRADGADIGVGTRHHHIDYGAAHIARNTVKPLVGVGCQFDLCILIGAIKLEEVFTTIGLGQAEREYLVVCATMRAVMVLLVDPDLGDLENGHFR